MLKNQNEAEYIEQYLKFWENFKIYLRWHRKIFMFLDRFYLSGKQTTLFNEGFKIMQEYVIDKFKNKLLKSIIAELNKQRNQDSVNEYNIKQAIKVFEITSLVNQIEILNDPLHPSGYDYFIVKGHLKTDYYIINFQRHYVKFIKTYFQQKAKEWLQLSVPEYVNQALKWLEDEEKWGKKYYP